VKREVTEKLPGYAPPPPARSSTPSEGSTFDDTPDSPDVLRLPKMTVRTRTLPPPADFTWLSPKGRLDLAMKSYRGLRIGNPFGLNKGIALAMQREEQEVRTKARLADDVQRSAGTDDADSVRIRRLLKAAMLRPNADWLAGPHR